MTRTSFFIAMSCYCRDSDDNDGKYVSSKNVHVKFHIGVLLELDLVTGNVSLFDINQHHLTFLQY